MVDATFSTKPNGDRVRDRLAIFTNTTMYRRGYDVLICTVDWQDRIVSVMDGPMVFKHGDFGTQMIQPTLDGSAGLEFLQAALDAAWAAGMRPKNWRLETTEQVAAMDNHLQDMRRLVFDQPAEIPNILKAAKGVAT